MSATNAAPTRNARASEPHRARIVDDDATEALQARRDRRAPRSIATARQAQLVAE